MLLNYQVLTYQFTLFILVVDIMRSIYARQHKDVMQPLLVRKHASEDVEVFKQNFVAQAVHYLTSNNKQRSEKQLALIMSVEQQQQCKTYTLSFFYFFKVFLIFSLSFYSIFLLFKSFFVLCQKKIKFKTTSSFLQYLQNN